MAAVRVSASFRMRGDIGEMEENVVFFQIPDAEAPDSRRIDAITSPGQRNQFGGGSSMGPFVGLLGQSSNL